ncbi:hypothetical protein [Methylobacterium sp. Leaf85]|uniref:hypothetical protein n=1 Tax=Methylobacterium sp. Leaf85 TaxID=1736241 RepID=UPI000ADB7AEA|nr:hypothetical protein [Methylobacterium sp. Leaf85]
MWEDRTLGHLVSLKALIECEALLKPRARMPSWNEIQSDYPELICYRPEPNEETYFVSHRWDGLEHPDPTGWQLEALINWGKQARYSGDHKAINVWLDYMSLPQKPRNEAENIIFQSGLGNIRKTISLLRHATLVSISGNSDDEDLAAMCKRGWIFFELLIAKDHTKYSKLIFERYGVRQIYTSEVVTMDYVKNLNETICIDSPQLIYAWFKKNHIVCTNGSDLLYLCSLLHEHSNKINHRLPPPGVDFNVVNRFSIAEMLKYTVNRFSGLSPRFPNLFMKELKYYGSEGDKEAFFDVLFVYRPPVPEIDVWIKVRDLPIDEMMIDLDTGNSKMYPGVNFEFDPESGAVRATVI